MLVKPPAGQTNASQGAPSPWRQRVIDGCHRAEGQTGNKERGVALWHMPSIQHCGGAEGIVEEGGGEEARKEMRGRRDLLRRN